MDISLTPPASNAAGTSPASPVKDASTASFKADVIDASMSVPVLVDFWAPWCGPCRQLGPALEKVVAECAGRVKLVKINVDENQALAGQMGVQSIPAVFAFAGGKPVDGFMGALPETEIRAFVQKLLNAAAGGPGSLEDQIAEALDAAANALVAGDNAAARQIYETVLQHAPDNARALTGMAGLMIAAGDLDGAEAALGMVGGEDRDTPEYLSASAALQLKRESEGLGSIAELEARLAANPGDNQARFDLALALNAEGRKLEAAEALVALMRRDRDWGEDAARKKLIELIEAWGPKDPATARARRLLSAALFS